MRILIDTNVILDILQKREPFFADSYRALRKAIESDAECLLLHPPPPTFSICCARPLGLHSKLRNRLSSSPSL